MIARPIWHGVLVGIIVATPLVVRQRFAIEPVLLVALTLLAGRRWWMGGQPNQGEPTQFC